MAVTRKIAEFVVEKEFGDLPNDVVKKVELCVLDFIGCALGGSREREIEILANLAKMGGMKESTVIGYGCRVPMLYAGIVNGAMGHALQLDDGDRFTMAHLGTEIIPAALAVAESEKSSGKDLINAIALGYEVAMRIGQAILPSHHRRGFCPNSTLGVFGAAVAAGKLLKLDFQQMADAVGSAGTQASGLEEFIIDGSGSQFLNPAHATFSGILSALLAKKGFTGSRTILEGQRGFCKAFSDEYDLSVITADLGEKYQIMKVYFKPYPTCRCMHSAIDAIIDTSRQYSIEPEDVEKVTVKTYSYNVNLMCGNSPETVAHARLHMPYCLACALAEKQLTINEFRCEKLKDPKILNLMKKFEFVISDEELNQFAPYLWGTMVSILTKNGKRYEKKVAFPKGEPENPLTEEELMEKFETLTEFARLDQKKMNRLKGMVIQLERIQNINDVVECLCIDDLR